MKIKDILNPLMSLKDKYYYAARIRKCTDLIKGDIRRWKETGEFPTRSIDVESPVHGGGRVNISMEDLIEIYHLDTLDAFIYMDDLLKATTNPDKTELVELLGRLKSTGCVHNGNVTPELLEQIRREQPGVWAAYERLLAQEEDALKEIEAQDPLNDDV